MGVTEGQTTFAGRLRDTLIAEGVDSLEALALRCRKAGKERLTRERIQEVIADPEHAMFCDVSDLAEVLRRRSGWLVRGTGISLRPDARSPDESRVMETYSSLTAERQRIFVALMSKLLQ